MSLAGHADFKTAQKFYLAVADNLKDRTSRATAQGCAKNWCSGHFGKTTGKM
jgi:hypothetical protein